MQGDRLPHPVGVRLRDAVLPQHGGRQVRSLQLEAGLALGQAADAEVVHHGRGEEQAAIVGGILAAPFVGGQELREEEAAQAVIGDGGALGAPGHGERGFGQLAGRHVKREGHG